MRKRTVWLALAAALLVVIGTAVLPGVRQSSQSPDLERVVRRYSVAVDGQESVIRIRTREIHGTFEYRGVEQRGTGRYEMRWRAPTALVEQLRGPMGVVTRGYDGVRA